MSSGDRRPRGIRPVTRIELTESNVKRRFILIVLFLAIGVTALAVGLVSLLNTDPGWHLVEVSSTNPNCSTEFTLNYYFGGGDMSASAESKQVNQLYTQATEDAFKIFSPDVSEDGLYNLCYVNQHINEEITVDETLYRAFELMQKYGNRCIYLAPAYVEYTRVFLSESDAEAAQYDPARNPEIADYVGQAAAFANDPTMINLELLGNYRIRLHVAEEYLAFAEENGIETFLDFGWMTNAFIADFLADVLTENGFTSGYLASYDGFTRNLDNRGEVFGFNIFDRIEADCYMPGTMSYDHPISIVFLRNYPLGERDRWHYYGFEDGSIVTTLLDPADGVSKSSVNNLVSYSNGTGCAEILMQMIPVFISDTFSSETVNSWTANGINSIWCEDKTICYNEADLNLQLVEATDGTLYSKAYAGN